MIRYLIEVYKVEVPDHPMLRRDDIVEATEDELNRTRDFQYQIQGDSLPEIALKLSPPSNRS